MRAFQRWLVSLLRGSSLCFWLVIPAMAYADCANFTFANIASEAYKDLYDWPIVFTALIKDSRVTNWTKTSVPRFWEDYQVLDVIKGTLPSPTSYELALECDTDDCMTSFKVARDWVKSRIGHRVLILAHEIRDKAGHARIVTGGACNDEEDIDTPHGQNLIAALKRVVESRKK